MKKLQNPLYAVMPNLALIPPLVMLIKNGCPIWVIIAAFIILSFFQFILNTAPDISEKLEKDIERRQTAAFSFDFSLAKNQVSPGALFPAWQGRNLQWCFLLSWILIFFTDIFAVFVIEEKLGIPGPIRLENYAFLFAISVFLMVLQLVISAMARRKYKN